MLRAKALPKENVTDWNRSLDLSLSLSLSLSVCFTYPSSGTLIWSLVHVARYFRLAASFPPFFRSSTSCGVNEAYEIDLTLYPNPRCTPEQVVQIKVQKVVHTYCGVVFVAHVMHWRF